MLLQDILCASDAEHTHGLRDRYSGCGAACRHPGARHGELQGYISGAERSVGATVHEVGLTCRSTANTCRHWYFPTWSKNSLIYRTRNLITAFTSTSLWVLSCYSSVSSVNLHSISIQWTVISSVFLLQIENKQKRGEIHKSVGTLIVAHIYLQLIQNRYMFRSFTVLHCSHQHCVQPVASDVEVVG